MELTQLSANEYSRLLSERMTPAMAAEYLREERIVLRSFSEVLRRIYPEDDLYEKLVSGFCDKPGDAEAAARKIRNWLSGKNRPSSREDVFRIAFSLGLSEGDTGYLLGLCSDFGIHYRNGRDLVYAWFLRNGRTYSQARAFYESLPPVPVNDTSDLKHSDHATREIQTEFARVYTEEDLREEYIRNLHRFGELHLRAYRYFNRYLDQLIHPAPAWGGTREPDYSMEAVMQQYLNLHVPSGKDRQNYSLIQKLIKNNWPNTTALKNIRSGKKDVPRKLLLLLYVITENVVDDVYSELDEDYLSLEERVEDHWWSLNALLNDCGMPQLDPRNPTDWLVLYAIAADGEAMSERLEKVIDSLFSDI